MAANNITVHLVKDNEVVYIPFTPKTIAEDVCLMLCKRLSIGPVARHLFAFRITGEQIYIPSISTFTGKHSYDFRIRYKMPNTAKLKQIDKNAYDYYFYQVRSDVLENKIPDIVYENCKRELVGLGVTDMYRVMIEKDLTRESVESDYKKYIPKEVLKRHSIFIKKPIQDSLGKIEKAGYDSWYIKMEYLKQLETLAPEYLAEQYKAETDQDGKVCNVYIKVSPFHQTQPGIRISFESDREKWQHVCSIEDLCFISKRDDGTVEISRKNGIPFYLKFTIPDMLSFVSVLDGYYRLMCKWIFNLCKDIPTSLLQKLYSMKCHGPVGGEFSYAKLQEKRNNRPGSFIIRESDNKFNVYYIDVCMKNSKTPKTFKLERLINDEFIFNDDLKKYKSIQQLIEAYSDPKEYIYLRECLPPSEYDKSPLLLCRDENIAGDLVTDSSEVQSLLSFAPLCINRKDFQVYKGQKKEGLEGITTVYRSMWRVTKGKKMEVAMKVLKHTCYEKYLKDFMKLSDRWGFLQSNAIVRLYGVIVTSPVSMVLEQVRLGPLDSYLRDNKSIVKPEDLIQAASNLASALWYLEENGFVHGNIRCRKILVSCHEENLFTVKLGDPGVGHTYASSDVHWIPVECYSNLNYVKRFTAADVWASGTTLWEIFMFGQPITETADTDYMEFYASGNRLAQPPDCPNNIYQLMQECWIPDPHKRKQPQTLLRDISTILHQVYNSRRTKISTKSNLDSQIDTKSVNSVFSTATESTWAEAISDDLISISDEDDLITFSKEHFYNHQLNLNQDMAHCEYDVSTILSSYFSVSTSVTSIDSINSMQCIFELDADCDVILQGRIGQGFYGEVYKGTLEYSGDGEPRQVAVKKLKASAVSTCLQDFEREISIMKALKHPNIVEILGVLQEPEVSLVMEFVQHGSLQSYLKIHRDSLTTKQLLKYAYGIAQGMAYLGTKHIVHRDLAARNILVVDKDNVKISDFGLAQVMGSNEYYILKTNRELPIRWYAPESLRNGRFSSRSDVWSYGVTMWEMFTYGEDPRLQIETTEASSIGQEQQNLLKAIESGARLPCPPLCPRSIYVRIIYPCWQGNPHERPTFQELSEEIEDLITLY